MTGEEEKWAEKSEWTRGGRESGSGRWRRRAGAAPLPRGTPPARLAAPPALEAGAGEPTLSPDSNPARPPPPPPPCSRPHPSRIPGPPSTVPPSSRELYLLSPRANPPHSLLLPPPPAFYLGRPRSKLCLSYRSPFPSASRPPPPFLTQSLHSNSLLLQGPPTPRIPPHPLQRFGRKWGARRRRGRGGGGGAGRGRRPMEREAGQMRPGPRGRQAPPSSH